MVTKDTAKYGNEFMLLNINAEDGITGWRRLPVYEMQRLENGITNPYMAVGSLTQVGEVKPDDTKFLWVGKSVNIPYQNWQVAHFRLINDSTFLPYGTSWLHKARRSWRMLTMMEDMMLIYRLERSVERRVFKIYTGAIDDKDVPAYMQQVANQFKRTPIIDPQTGQIDLSKPSIALCLVDNNQLDNYMYSWNTDLMKGGRHNGIDKFSNRKISPFYIRGMQNTLYCDGHVDKVKNPEIVYNTAGDNFLRTGFRRLSKK